MLAWVVFDVNLIADCPAVRILTVRNSAQSHKDYSYYFCITCIHFWNIHWYASRFTFINCFTFSLLIIVTSTALSCPRSTPASAARVAEHCVMCRMWGDRQTQKTQKTMQSTYFHINIIHFCCDCTEEVSNCLLSFPGSTPLLASVLELQTNLRKDYAKSYKITEKAPTRAFSWLKEPTSTFSHYFVK